MVGIRLQPWAQVGTGAQEPHAFDWIRLAMPDLETQHAILDAESYWFGAPLGAPKVYDSGTNFHASPSLRGSALNDAMHRLVDDSGARTVTYRATGDEWTVLVEEA